MNPRRACSLPRLRTDVLSGGELSSHSGLGSEQKSVEPTVASSSHVPLPTTIEGERWQHHQTRGWLQREMTTTRWLQDERAKILQSREQWVEAWTQCNHSLVRCDNERVSLAQQREAYIQLTGDLRAQIELLQCRNNELVRQLTTNDDTDVRSGDCGMCLLAVC